MCGRFTLALSPEEIARLLAMEAALDADLGLQPRWNVAPGQELTAAVQETPQGPRETRLLRWGLVPAWSKAPLSGSRMINARSETVHAKPAFRRAFQARRCLVPADGFYEWKREGSRKQPWLFRLRDEPGFAMAGLWERWCGPAGEVLDTCTLLTTVANALMAPIHDRMPVILRPDDFTAWLTAPPADADALHALLRPYPAEAMTAWPVSARVNAPRNEGPELVVPVDPDPPGGGQLALL